MRASRLRCPGPSRLAVAGAQHSDLIRCAPMPDPSPDSALLWRLRGQHQQLTCFAVQGDGVVAVRVEHDGELVVAEGSTSMDAALARAEEVRAELERREFTAAE